MRNRLAVATARPANVSNCAKVRYDAANTNLAQNASLMQRGTQRAPAINPFAVSNSRSRKRKQVC